MMLTIPFCNSGGTFNPLHEAGFAGKLAHEPENEYGCNAFKNSYTGRVIIVKRGKCWFHEKSIRAQEAGGIGLVIANDNRPMADIMEGVESLPAPYIISVLVERDVGAKMLGTGGNVYVFVFPNLFVLTFVIRFSPTHRIRGLSGTFSSRKNFIPQKTLKKRPTSPWRSGLMMSTRSRYRRF